VRETLFGMAPSVPNEKRLGWLKEAEDLGRQAG
jgi:hypothetical protein